MPDITSHGDTRKAYEDFGISRESGVGQDYLDWARKQKTTLATKMGLPKCYHRPLPFTPAERPKTAMSDLEILDALHEGKGWYRTVRAAKMEHVNPVWLAYACHCGLIPCQRAKDKSFFIQQYRVQLEEVRKWKATL
jgi:hypothetical protein